MSTINRSHVTTNNEVAGHRRRGTVVIVVLWSLAIAAIIVGAVQMFSFRQAALGRETLERVQARWAARAGIEHTIAVMEFHTQDPVPDDAFALPDDMARVAAGDTINASYDIRHHVRGRDYYGPMDEHSRLNINVANMAHLMMLDNMWLDIAEAILSWRNSDFEHEGLGVTRDYYLSLNPPYEPRQADYQNMAELELAAGVWPKYLRGEDWNLNNRLDLNENDGNTMFPPDQQDNRLDGGWSSYLTAYSVGGGSTGSGEPLLYLPDALIAEVMERIGVEELQARALIRFGRSGANPLARLLFTPISHIDGEGRLGDQPYNPELPDLTHEQLVAVFDELTMDDPEERRPGKININTVDPDFLRDLLELYGADVIVADEILFLRDSRPEGIASIVEFLDVPEMTDDLLLQFADVFTTRSNVYTISARARSHGTGLEHEMIVVVDRSTVPARILEYREQ